MKRALAWLRSLSAGFDSLDLFGYAGVGTITVRRRTDQPSTIRVRRTTRPLRVTAVEALATDLSSVAADFPRSNGSHPRRKSSDVR